MIILLNGAIASGKTKIGKLLEKALQEQGHSVSFYDLDAEVEKIRPGMVWPDEKMRLHDWLTVRKKLAEKVSKQILQKKIIIIAGPFFTEPELKGFIDYLTADIPVYLYTLHAAIEQRLDREKIRNRNEAIILIEQEQLLAKLPETFGSVVENTDEPEITVLTLLQLLKNGEGLLDRSLIDLYAKNDQ